MGARSSAALLAALAVVAVGCGGSSSEGGSGEAGNSGAPVEGKKGGKVTFLAAADVDYLDPGQTYYTFGYAVAYATQRPLYSFKQNVPSGYATSYFGDIKGAPKAPGKFKSIEGIKTPDDSTLVIELTTPTAVTVAAALVMPITIPVPQEYAEKFDRKSPSTYDQYTVFTGPYMVRNDPDGKVVGRDPGKLIEIVRNPNWDPETDFKPAYLDEIRIEEGNDDLTVASRRTLQGDGLMCCDSGQPPIAILRRAITSNKDQLGRVGSGGTRWIALRTDRKPFDNLNVRKAVVAAFNRESLLKTRGGREVGPIAQGYIPPGVPGFDESGGEKGFSEFDFMQNPQGDAELAKEYMLKAKEEGVPVDDQGRYAGSKELVTIATNADPGLQTATVAQGQLQEMGFELTFRKVPQDTLYTRFCNVPSTNWDVCPNVGWFRDFTDPQSLLEPTFKGAAIKPQGNVNYSMLDVPEIDDAMTKAATIPAGEERNKAWAEINRMVVGQVPGIPYSWDDSFQLASKDVQGVMNGYTTTWDFTYSSVK